VDRVVAEVGERGGQVGERDNCLSEVLASSSVRMRPPGSQSRSPQEVISNI
jgi:hypothetical protein